MTAVETNLHANVTAGMTTGNTNFFLSDNFIFRRDNGLKRSAGRRDDYGGTKRSRTEYALLLIESSDFLAISIHLEMKEVLCYRLKNSY